VVAAEPTPDSRDDVTKLDDDHAARDNDNHNYDNDKNDDNHASDNDYGATDDHPPGSVPGSVTPVAKSGGGSGEVVVDWTAVPGATGYRIFRTNADGGQPRIVADLNITTGRTTAAPEVVNIWSADHSYVPGSRPRTSPDPSPWFQYVDVGEGRRCYRMLAYNAAGNGPLSAITCGYPIGQSH
jgi:hypothetical protein